jgi:hypothetical protein
MPRGTVELTEDAIKEFREAFSLFDKDGDGSISVAEVRASSSFFYETPARADGDGSQTRCLAGFFLSKPAPRRD